MDNLGPIENPSDENPSEGEEDLMIDNQNNWSQDDSYTDDDVFLFRDRMDDFTIYSWDLENQIFEIYKDQLSCGLSELKKALFSYFHSKDLNKESKSENLQYDCDNDETQSSCWNDHINRCINNYMRSQTCMDSSILIGNENYSNSYIYDYIFRESVNDHESESSNIQTSMNGNDFQNNQNLDINKSANDSEIESSPMEKYKHLWLRCENENCYALIYKKFFKSQMNICDNCGYHMKMNSSDRIELLIDPGTWDPMDEDMFSLDPIEFHSEEELYKDRLDSYQRETGLTEAVQTGTGQLKGIPVAIGVMDFQFIGGSMGSVVGEKITRLIEYAADKSLPLIIVCASGGARMQEGSVSLMQMAKISSALYHYQVNLKLLYVSILTSPTTGGVTASFGMLGDIIIAEPNAYIAFAGKRVIEQTLNITIPEGSQEAEPLFENGLFDLMVPRNLLKGVLSELFQLHNYFPLNQN
uniref:Acetyl-coenzyme A carboxylase carboxyl transferase subunit beta, chloroplastic n=1 Tax=Tetraena mongolica TaxID=66646 RepID=A0A6B9PIW4_9ROSI|nr:Acetyl-CoA carboxylase carboxyltransferase beta subunit [Tetraena mongolica]UZU69712.1 acetyl-CoA carboxylase carboxyltransferase beta subunit [Tetraena mongolica]UZU69779.1 acetyl-CoA carboxylase carboxyltransferase beta subunit [Tetraena mongolica]UZU69846.1 acetyl-CoA carboxylase carboxyltransferase beta subunit [Tetraena mongolica]UZU69913.1 acetyl-CoA carboxylase carboxyltransferase beta subunit [Tetraena mongolica]